MKKQELKEEFGIKIIEVNPSYTSQICSKCGYVDKKNRKSQTVFICGFCGSKQNPDVNAVRNLLFRSSSKKLLSSIYINKSKILDELVKLFIKRYNKQVYCYSIIQANPYFSVRMKPPQ